MLQHRRWKTRRPKVTAEQIVVEELLKEMKKPVTRDVNYRERSQQIHGLICAKCAREFEPKDKHLLTVHHKDGNHHNTQPGGPNWANLCVYCRDDERSRRLMNGYLLREK